MGIYTDTLRAETAKLKPDSPIFKGISSEFDRMIVVEWLNNFASLVVNNIDALVFDADTYNNNLYLMFNYSSYLGASKGSLQVQNNIIDTLDYILDLIIKGEQALRVINKKLSDLKDSNGSILSIKYCPGFGAFARVGYWDYTNLVIKLSLDSMDKLASYVSTEDIERDIIEAVEGLSWTEYAPLFIEKFNSLRINYILKAKMNYSSISDALIDNMISLQDVRRVLLSGKFTIGEQQITSVFVVKELGTFIAIVIWRVDYGSKKVSINVLDNKVIDIENKRFVSDHSLYSRIEQRVLSESNNIITEYSATNG